MKNIRSAFLLFCVLSSSAFAAEPLEVAQIFYDGYLRTINEFRSGEKYVRGSAYLTPEFKKSYAERRNKSEGDPIICGQDFPSAGFEATNLRLSGGNATITMKSRDPSFPHSFAITLIRRQGEWLISGTEDLQ